MLRYFLLPVALGATVTLSAQSTTSFELKRDSATPTSSLAIVQGDFNQDGKPDFVVGSANNSVTLQLGNGDGTFQSPRTIGNTDSQILAMQAADVNHDGHLDVIALSVTNYAYVFYGDGNGTFQAGTPVSTPSSRDSLAVADFNGDGLLDLAVGGYNGVQLFTNVGGRNFTPGKVISVGSGSNVVTTVHAGDFDGNGTIDLAVGSIEGAYVLWGDGRGSFTSVLLKSYSAPAFVGVGDLNQEGNPDILVAASCGTPPPPPSRGPGLSCTTVDVFYGGQGYQNTFYRHVITDNGSQDSRLTAVDVNGDGIADITASGFQSNAQNGLFVYLGHPDGSFDQTPQRYIFTSDDVEGTTAGDFNRDGMIDFLQVGGGSTEIYLNATRREPCGTSAISPAVTVCSPVDNTYSPSPVRIRANAFDRTQVTALQQYIDGREVYRQSAGSFNLGLAEPVGMHFLVTKAFDAKGVSFRSNRTVYVYSGTPGLVCPTAPSSAAICFPSTATANSPVHIVANGNTAYVPTAAQLYIDGSLVINDRRQELTYAPGGSSAVDTVQTLSRGAHSLVFKLYDANGHLYTASKSITVQ